MKQTPLTPWPRDCRQLVATFAPNTTEAARLVTAPHHRRAEGFSPSELSSRLGKLMHKAGGAGQMGRAFSASLRRDRQDPFSLALAFTTAEERSGMARVARFVFSDPGSAGRAAQLLHETGMVQSVHPVLPMAMRFPQHDDNRLELPSAQPGGWAYGVVHAAEALDMEPGSSDVTVGVLDTGVELTHPDLKSRTRAGYDFVHIEDGYPNLVGDVRRRDSDPTDDAGHGTHVAGIIGSRGLRMLPGVGGNCTLLAVRILGTMLEAGKRVGVGIIPDIDDGIKYAVDEGVDVINLSLGLHAIGPGAPHRRAVEYARLHNVVVVAAAGNDGTDVPVYPGALPGVITVGAVNELQRSATLSSWGPFIDLVAPGTAIYSTDLNGGYRYRNGTSHAAPFVSGATALIVARARRQGLSFKESTIRRILRDTAERPDRRYSDPHLGSGLLNISDAVQMASQLIRSQQRRSRRAEDVWGHNPLHEPAESFEISF